MANNISKYISELIQMLKSQNKNPQKNNVIKLQLK